MIHLFFFEFWSSFSWSFWFCILWCFLNPEIDFEIILFFLNMFPCAPYVITAAIALVSLMHRFHQSSQMCLAVAVAAAADSRHVWELFLELARGVESRWQKSSRPFWDTTFFDANRRHWIYKKRWREILSAKTLVPFLVPWPNEPENGVPLSLVAYFSWLPNFSSVSFSQGSNGVDKSLSTFFAFLRTSDESCV